ncbi:MAG: tRNA pseudouridine(38-40) synthase TruA [DPANN group archaeon]|nr:tRNA pseudouridine(38-40) synthase TruA [DPANN group archaeon]
METVYLKFAYLGDNFSGLQMQPHFLKLRTVEGDIVTALIDLGIIISKTENSVRVLSRTDKGVSAIFNIISFKSDKTFKIGMLNSILKNDLWVLAKSIPKESFDSIKTTSAFGNRFKKRYRYLLFGNYNIIKIKEALFLFSGTHDFSNFSKRDLTKNKSPIRTIEVKVTRKKYLPDVLIIDIRGKGFLWQMVRRIIQCAVDYANDKISLDKISRLLDGADTKSIKPIAAKNLMLFNVDSEIIFEKDDYHAIKFLKTLRDDAVRKAVFFDNLIR